MMRHATRPRTRLALAALLLCLWGLMGLSGGASASGPYNGTAVGSPSYTTDAGFGQAVTTASGQYVTLGTNRATDPFNFTTLDSFAVEVRFKTSSAAGFQCLVGVSGSGLVGLSGGVPFFLVASGLPSVSGSASVADGAWHWLTVVVQYGGIDTLYIDGARLAQSTGTASAWWNGAQSQIGAGQGGQYSFLGSVSEVRISNTPRYTGVSYVVPTAPLVADAATVALYHLDGSAVDSVGPDARLVAIGDSTAIGQVSNSGVAGVTDAAVILAQQKAKNVYTANGAVPGSSSGNWASGATAENTAYTGTGTNDWQYALSKAGGSLAGDWVLLRLGVNDAQSHVASATFQANMAALIAQIRAQGAAGVLLSYPTWREPGTYAQDGSTVFDTSTTAYLLAYQGVCDALVDGSFVFAGDKTSYTRFQNQPSVYMYYGAAGYSTTGNQGAIHENRAGAEAMGRAEAAALSGVLFPATAQDFALALASVGLTPSAPALTLTALHSDGQWKDVHAVLAGNFTFNTATKAESVYDYVSGAAVGTPQVGFLLTQVSGVTTSRTRTN